MKDMTQQDDAGIDAAVAAVAAAPASEPTDILDEIAKLREAPAVPFRDFGDAITSAELEDLGVWQRWPDIEEGEFLIAHMSASHEKRQALEERFREKHKIDEPVLPPNVREALFRESFFGTVVKGWRNVKRNGQPFEFNAENYRTAIRVRSFRQWVFKTATDAERFRAKRDEALRGNS